MLLKLDALLGCIYRKLNFENISLGNKTIEFEDENSVDYHSYGKEEYWLEICNKFLKGKHLQEVKFLGI